MKSSHKLVVKPSLRTSCTAAKKLGKLENLRWRDSSRNASSSRAGKNLEMALTSTSLILPV
jgi:hypothetical protein